MQYSINFKPLFSKTGKFNGYDMSVAEGDVSLEGFDKLVIEGGDNEFARFEKMLDSLDPFSEEGLFVVDIHPLEIINYLRGESPIVAKRTTDWQNEVDRWKVNMKGERI